MVLVQSSGQGSMYDSIQQYVWKVWFKGWFKTYNLGDFNTLVKSDVVNREIASEDKQSHD